MDIAYHASHEQFAPRHLLELVAAAEAAGFDAIHSSDHFHSWSSRQGHSGHAWAWLGSAMATTRLRTGVVTAPGQRYHPAIIAQAAATLAQMFPNRFWMAVGSGQLLNEGITGEQWPPKTVRQERLRESVDIIRALWEGRTVTHYGMIQVEEARLEEVPENPPMLLGAAVSPQTAEWVGSWADGMVTVSHPREKLREVVEAFRRGGGKGKPMFLKVQLSFAATDEEALAGAVDQWRAPILDSSVQAMLRSPEQFDAAVEHIPPEAVRQHVRISCDLDKQAEWLAEDAEMGFEMAILHNVNRDQERFIKAFASSVLPMIKGR